jgi:hypothetical protein
MKWRALLGCLLCALASGTVRADSASPSSALSSSDATGPLPAPRASSVLGRDILGPSPAFTGPRVKLSYRLVPLRDSLGGRLAHVAGFSGFLPTKALRAGATLEAGARDQALGAADAYLAGSLFAGYQLLGRAEPAVPYVVAQGELGVLFGKHFHTPISNGLRGAGLEIGCDLRWVRGLTTGVGLTFMLYSMDGLAYQSLGLRASIGL